jgi:large subunit ribosomal protein L21
MYAVIKTGGKQYSVEQGDRLFIEKLNAEPGAEVTFDQVLYLSADDSATDGSAKVGTPYLDAVRVNGTVVENGKAKKVITFKYKAKKDSRKKRGHRQHYTLVEIDAITVDGKIVSVKPAKETQSASEDEDAKGPEALAEAVKTEEAPAEIVEDRASETDVPSETEAVAETAEAVEKAAAKRTAKPKADEDTDEKPAVKRTAKPKAAKDETNTDADEKPAAKRVTKPKAAKDETDAEE